MTQGYLAGGSHEDVQTHGQYDVDHDDIEQIDVIIGNNQRKGEQDKQQHDRPEKNHPALKKLNVLVVVTFHIHDSTSTREEYFPQSATLLTSFPNAVKNYFPPVFHLDFRCATPLYVSALSNGSTVCSNPNGSPLGGGMPC
jgi:hypothetical protein